MDIGQKSSPILSYSIYALFFVSDITVLPFEESQSHNDTEF